MFVNNNQFDGTVRATVKEVYFGLAYLGLIFVLSRFSSPWRHRTDGAMASFRPCGTVTTPSALSRAMWSQSTRTLQTAAISKFLPTYLWSCGCYCPDYSMLFCGVQ